MIRGFTEALRGSNGGIELNRVVGFLGGLAYIVGAHAYIAWNMARGASFDLTEYCLTFPPGLAVVAGGTALAVSVKDKAVAAARATEKETAQP